MDIMDRIAKEEQELGEVERIMEQRRLENISRLLGETARDKTPLFVKHLSVDERYHLFYEKARYMSRDPAVGFDEKRVLLATYFPKFSSAGTQSVWEIGDEPSERLKIGSLFNHMKDYCKKRLGNQ